jgi:hypothetical protein
VSIEGWWLSGPQGSEALIFNKALIEPVVKVLAEHDRHDPDDYTATHITNIAFDVHEDAIVKDEGLIVSDRPAPWGPGT